MESSESNQSPSRETLVFNIGGQIHEVLQKTLQQFPNTRLATTDVLSKHYLPEKGTYFFDRNPQVFGAVLNYYRTGKLHLPEDVCVAVTCEEFKYWDINIDHLEDCCWLKYSAHQDTMSMLEKIEKQTPGKETEEKSWIKPNNSCFARIQQPIWAVLNEPASSIAARIYVTISVVIILSSIFTFCAMTHPVFNVNMTLMDYAEYYQVSEGELAFNWRNTSDPQLMAEVLKYSWFYDNYAKNKDYPHAKDKKANNHDEEYNNEGNSHQSTNAPTNSNQNGSSNITVSKHSTGSSKVRKKHSTESQGKHTGDQDASQHDAESQDDNSSTSLNKKKRVRRGISKAQHRSRNSSVLARHQNAEDISGTLDPRHLRFRRNSNETPASETVLRSANAAILPNHPSRSNLLRPPHPVLLYIDYACFCFFMLDFLIRLIFCPSKLRFLKSILNWCDFLANVGFIIEFLINRFLVQERYQDNILDVLSALKVLRVFRIFRIMRYHKGVKVLYLTFKTSLKELLLLLVFLGSAVLFFGALVYYFDGQTSSFESIPDGCWWAIVTMTTVGYGDFYPVSFAGRVVGCVCALSGVFVIGFTVPIVVNNFTIFYQFMNADRSPSPKSKWLKSKSTVPLESNHGHQDTKLPANKYKKNFIRPAFIESGT